MAVLNVIMGIVIVAIVAIILILIIVVVALRQRRAQIASDDRHALALKELNSNDQGNGSNNTYIAVKDSDSSDSKDSDHSPAVVYPPVVYEKKKHGHGTKKNHHEKDSHGMKDQERGWHSDSSDSCPTCSDGTVSFTDSSSSSTFSDSSSSSDPSCSTSNSSSSNSSDSSSSSSSDSSNSSSSSCTKGCGCPCERKCGCRKCVKPCAPTLSCIAFEDGQFHRSCGSINTSNGATGQYYIQWFPGNCGEHDRIAKYTIYVKKGTDTVSSVNYDYIYHVSPEAHYFMTPDIGPDCWSFMIIATNECGDSSKSETFNTFECNSD